MGIHLLPHLLRAIEILCDKRSWVSRWFGDAFEFGPRQTNEEIVRGIFEILPNAIQWKIGIWHLWFSRFELRTSKHSRNIDSMSEWLMEISVWHVRRASTAERPHLDTTKEYICRWNIYVIDVQGCLVRWELWKCITAMNMMVHGFTVQPYVLCIRMRLFVFSLPCWVFESDYFLFKFKFRFRFRRISPVSKWLKPKKPTQLMMPHAQSRQNDSNPRKRLRSLNLEKPDWSRLWSHQPASAYRVRTITVIPLRWFSHQM